jgi:calcium-translocating P-type ATPase
MPVASRPWHATSAGLTLETLGARIGGLTAADVQTRLARDGPNRLPAPKRRGVLARFLAQFQDILVYTLLAAAAITALLGDYVDCVVILAVVLIDAVIGFVQESRAERALEAVAKLVSLRALVLRDGARRQVPAETIVVGDVVLFRPGDRVPADLRIVAARGLALRESALTGESMPVVKQVESVPEDTLLAERRSIAYAGTIVVRGEGEGVVVATGESTEIGRLAKLMAELEPTMTPLLRQLKAFGQRLAIWILGLAGLAFLFGTFVHGQPVQEMFLAAVGIAVAAIPEGLPAILTITLAVGVRQMAARHAIIRHLPAAEALGSVTVICTDKTGTLTRDEMSVRSIYLGGREILFGVAGNASPVPEARELLEVAVRASDVAALNDPTEQAIVERAKEIGIDPQELLRLHPPLDFLPFESERRYMAAMHRTADGATRLCVKGAPERILAMCEFEVAQGAGRRVALRREDWHAAIAGLAGRGERVLAVAFGDPNGDRIEPDRLPRGLTFAGLIGLADAARPEAVAAVGDCRQAGIRVMMITGDHAITAAAVAREVGLERADRAISGGEIEALSASEFAAVAREYDVFARATPEQKLRLVETLQAQGEIVAMTGDGVNDAPALKRADIGIAMGIKGTEAAREAAQMVLADDNFASIARAVAAGRTVYDNLRKSILFILPTDGGEALSVLAAILFGVALPITAGQILWVNTVTAVTLGLAFAFEASESDVMRRPPRRPGEAILDKSLLRRIGMVSVLVTLGVFALFLGALEAGRSIEAARTAAVNGIVAAEAAYLLNCRYLLASSLNWRGIAGSPVALGVIAMIAALQLAFTYWKPLQSVFNTAPIGPSEWVAVGLMAVAIFLMVEGEKWWLRRRLLPQ